MTATPSPTSTTAEQIGRTVRANLPSAELYEYAIRAGEGIVAADGPLVVRTGKHTGRSPKDKFVVREPESEKYIFWGETNRPITPAAFDRLQAGVFAHLRKRDLYVQDLYAGAAPGHRLNVRIITEFAWHSLFVRQLFIRPPFDALADHKPEFTVVCAPGFHADAAGDGLNSEAFILLNLVLSCLAKSRLPEPLRIAHLIGQAVVLRESRGRV